MADAAKQLNENTEAVPERQGGVHSSNEVSNSQCYRQQWFVKILVFDGDPRLKWRQPITFRALCCCTCDQNTVKRGTFYSVRGAFVNSLIVVYARSPAVWLPCCHPEARWSYGCLAALPLHAARLSYLSIFSTSSSSLESSMGHRNITFSWH